MLVKELKGLYQLSVKEEGVIRNLVDDWYQNADLWDLMQISGVDEMPVEDIKLIVREMANFSRNKQQGKGR